MSVCGVVCFFVCLLLWGLFCLGFFLLFFLIRTFLFSTCEVCHKEDY